MLYIEAEPRPAKPVPQSQTDGAFKFHGAVAEGYDDKREKTDKWLVEQRVITEWLSELPEGSNVLDCPVGTGRFLPVYEDRQLRVVGADISGDMLYRAAAKIDGPGARAWVDQCKAWVAHIFNLVPDPKPNDPDRMVRVFTDEFIPVTISGEGMPPLGHAIPFANGKTGALEVYGKRWKPLDIGIGHLVYGNILKTGAPDKAVDVAVCCRITRWLIGEHGPQGIIDMLREMQRVARKQIILTARVENHVYAVTEDLIKSGLSGWRITRNVAGYETAYRIMMLEPV